MRKLMIAASTSIALMGFTAGAVAQDAPAPEQQAQFQKRVSDAKLAQVVEAMSEVRAISGKYAEAFQNADDATKAQEIQQKAQQEMIDAVSESGLSTDEYNTIVQRLQTDEQLRGRMNELAGE
ncbi:DUF4168 domain-containing protein [Lacimicrobium alkaliphilum]|uniref:DUF4168 domain-containing protein n=1 Tax=Lacimicrobium alkaliphilum TaxID=1526571 RepID=A0A0U3AFW5_9ALTE|nr:DUF4168 domain-containing protein [Lacimicrobium alkaliphilum]ALS99918.1 hypothetical protein AT746_17705 [Lacimicrobium alkaliphilum]